MCVLGAAAAIFLKRHPKALLWLIGSIVSVMLLVVAFFAWPVTPRASAELQNARVLQGGDLLYQYSVHRIETLAPGNDSKVYALYRLRPAATASLLDSTTVLLECQKKPQACTHSPTWRPRSSLVRSDGLGYGLSDLRSLPDKSIADTYKALADDADTRCAAYDYSYGERDYSKPNMLAICVNSVTNIMTYEYISDQDSNNF